VTITRKPPVIPRTPRKFQEAPSACYHLMNWGHNREAVLADDEDRRYFLNLIVRYQKRFPRPAAFSLLFDEQSLSSAGPDE
jgi:hypothetical protein